jgi:hypothetical protein
MMSNNINSNNNGRTSNISSQRMIRDLQPFNPAGKKEVFDYNSSTTTPPTSPPTTPPP